MRNNWHSIREYEVLRAMILSGTTISAAKRLGISQSAVSRSLASLESRLGNSLFVRSGGRLIPTAEAVHLNKNLDTLFQALAGIEGRDENADKEKVLRIGAPPTMAHRFLHSRVVAFMQAQPQYRVLFEICDSDALLLRIAEERLDIGVSDLLSRHAGVKMTPFRRSKMVCLLPEKSPLTQLDVISPAQLKDVPLIAPIKRHSLRGHVDRMFSRAGITPRIAAEAATVVTIVELVRAGLGVAFINPFPIALSEPEGVCFRPVDPEIEYRTCFLTPVGAAMGAGTRSFMRFVRRGGRDDPWSQPIT
ncbi:LysR family transcriptional regulator [Nitratireductor sp. ZSWI3]|uniref:LysR family transcriptional regulator n=1 Tax=Nitratireductor sp. ZSWI3 TaxID=2966359 RepID=UPI002150237A|nr:LysR family transcriptional regulator [Nitratireductor sp. ZSWI3]MCR4265228.1 LysR family transcriptional regulator [Nitratireductor sp. ZSWI3]